MPLELLSLILVILLVTVLVLSLYLAMSLRDSRNYLLDQVSQKDRTIQDLMNKLMSRDAMTYATLTQVSSTSTFSDPYTPTGTDEVEWKRWMENNGRSTEDLDDDSSDLADLGFQV